MTAADFAAYQLEMVDLSQFKELAKKHLKTNSLLRELILRQPNEMPRYQATGMGLAFIHLYDIEKSRHCQSS
jgi:hypothetical protein